MKNIVYILAIAACISLIAYGVINKSGKPERNADNLSSATLQSSAPNGGQQDAASIPSAKPDSVAIATSTPISPDLIHYRPDQPSVSSSSAAANPSDAERTFIMTPEIVAKKYLVDKYKMGICFGEPLEIPQIAIDGMISRNKPFANYLRQAYGLKADLEVYNKMKQFQTIMLTETASSIYKYTFSDGQCQTVLGQEGIVTVSRGTATDKITAQQSHTY